jgi:hypothetical protein
VRTNPFDRNFEREALQLNLKMLREAFHFMVSDAPRGPLPQHVGDPR